MSDPTRELFRGDHILVRPHRDEGVRVAVAVGRNPDGAKPTIVDARDLADALDEYADHVECHHCDETVAYEDIADHHADEHPRTRWNPAFYPEVYDGVE